MHVIAVTGMPGAGKELAVEVATARGVPVVRMGDLVREATAAAGLDQTPEHVAATATARRARDGRGAWALALIPKVEALRAEGAVRVLVDGVRNRDEVSILRERLGTSFHLVAVEAPERTRHERLISRGRADDVAERAWLKARDARELGYGLGEVIQSADVTLANTGTMEEFRAAFEALLDEWTEA